MVMPRWRKASMKTEDGSLAVPRWEFVIRRSILDKEGIGRRVLHVHARESGVHIRTNPSSH